ncbi:MAG: winged helix-turn-helix transcriptional regulator [Candidatus Sabulitectum sp.]|nr:winged helix-turn-helix transcriptional regulator [Candidatus Sabulitectum sp.]
MSGVQLAEKLGMKTPRIIYYLKKLEKTGLARQIPRKPEQGYRICSIFIRSFREHIHGSL